MTTAPARTDNFAAPDGSVTVRNSARALASPPPGNWQFSARVSVDCRADYDAKPRPTFRATLPPTRSRRAVRFS